MIEQRVKRGRKAKLPETHERRLPTHKRSVGRPEGVSSHLLPEPTVVNGAFAIATALPLAMRVRGKHSQKLGPMRLSVARVFLAHAANAGGRGIRSELRSTTAGGMPLDAPKAVSCSAANRHLPPPTRRSPWYFLAEQIHAL